MANPIRHFEILGPDGAALQSFYRDLFGWTMNPVMPEYSLVEAGSASGIPGGIGDSEAPTVTVYAEVDDLQATLDEAVRLGGTVVMAPSEVPGGTMIAQFHDPAGNLFGLAKRQ
jgi:uncharacterized protein